MRPQEIADRTRWGHRGLRVQGPLLRIPSVAEDLVGGVAEAPIYGRPPGGLSGTQERSPSRAITVRLIQSEWARRPMAVKPRLRECCLEFASASHPGSAVVPAVGRRGRLRA